MSVTIGLQLPFGIQPVNPVPVDSWSGPFTGSIDTLQSAIDAANSSIPSAIRFQSMEARLIVSGTSHKFWYRDGTEDSDLVEFNSSDSSHSFFDNSTNTLTAENLSGSLTSLIDGTPYLIAGENVNITTGSKGQIFISTEIQSVPLITNIVWMETPAGDIDSVNMIFSLNNSPSPINSLMFFVNGVLQKQGTVYDYVISGSIVTLLTAPNADSNLSATYTYQTDPAKGTHVAWMETPLGDIDGINNVFVVANEPWPASSLMFYVNGVLQIQGENYDFSTLDKTITIFTPPGIGSNLTVMYPY